MTLSRIIYWREPVGTILAIGVLMAWLGLCDVAAQAAGAVFGFFPTLLWCIIFLLIVPTGAIGGLVIAWAIFDEIDFWIRGCRVHQLGRRVFFSWSLGPKNYVYEERAPNGHLQKLMFVRVILGDGYPPPSEVALPRNEDWESHTPSWAKGRRIEIIERMHRCFGGVNSATRLVDLK